MPRVWRLVHKNYLSSAFSGEGARLAGGRWNSEGFAVVYAAESLSLAMLEVIVHLEFREALKLYKAIPVSFSVSEMEVVDPKTLPPDWNKQIPHPATQLTGNRWIRGLSSPVLNVPSAVVPVESNFLLNPIHPGFPALDIGKPIDLPLDPRVLDRLK